MKNLEQYIAALLEEQDCVMIPGFGGFLLNHKQASFSTNGDELYPPSKGVSFNINLSANDGLLAQFIANEKSLSYTESIMYIKGEVSRWQYNLSEGAIIKLDQVGSIIQDQQGKRIFSPDGSYNFLKASYGLSDVLITKVERDKNVQAFKFPKSRPVYKKEISRRINYLAPALSMAACLLFLLFVVIINTRVENDKIALAIQNNGNKMAHVAVSLNNILAQTGQKTLCKIPEQPANFKFYVVGGSFKTEANARILEQSLKKKGFEASVINTEKGLYRVTYLQDRDSTKADQGLHKIKTSENQAAWLLKW